MSEGIEVIGYIRASADGKPEWSEDCVCEDAVYPNYDGDESMSMAICRLSDAQAIIARQAARIAELEQQRGGAANEREAFEARFPLHDMSRAQDEEGDTVYLDDWTQGAFIGWKARARLNPPGECVAEDGAGCICQACGTKYFHDLITPNDVWELIKPDGKAPGAGLLCPMCIVRRLGGIGWSAVHVIPNDQQTGECVAVPRELLDRVCWPVVTGSDRHTHAEAINELRALLAQQGKAVGDE